MTVLSVLGQIVALFAVFFVVYGLVIANGNLDVVYNSDLNYLFLLVADILRDPSAVLAWYHPPPLFIFPDWLLAIPLVILPLPPTLMPLAYAAIMLVFFSYVGGALLSRAGSIRYDAAVWALAAVVVFILGLQVLLDPSFESRRAWLLAFAPADHGGAIIAALCGLALLQPWATQETQRAGWLVILWVIVVVASFSDALFLPWFSAPAFVATLVWSWQRSSWRGSFYALGLLASALLSAWISEVLTPTPSYFSEKNLAGGLQRVNEAMLAAIANGDWPLLLILVLVVLLGIRSAYLFTMGVARRPFTSGEWLEMVTGGICVLALAAPIASGMAGPWRYNLIVFPTLALMATYYGVRLIGRWGVWLRLIVVGGPVATCAGLISVQYPGIQTMAAPLPLEQCLAQRGARTGLGYHFTANTVIFHTLRRVHIAQIFSDGGWESWMNNRRWFTARADDGTRVNPSFILPHGLDQAALEQAFGKPSSVENCSGTLVWYYDRGLYDKTPWLPETIATKLDLNGVIPAGALFAGSTGQLSSGARTAVAPTDIAGMLSYGPYAQLLPGRYRITIEYSAEGGGHTWDLADNNGAVEFRQLLPSTQGKRSTTGTEIAVPYGDNRVEVRTYFSGEGTLTLYGVGIKPLE